MLELAMREINLAELTGHGAVRNLSGHIRGQEARRFFGLDDADRGDEEVVICVPEEVYMVTPSFFQGMFASSVHARGNDREAFFRKFKFQADSVVLKQIDRGIAAVLTRRDSSLFS
ncbi:MAG TPA: hypothetical protein VF655_00990 [Allosphingosinicella sp.]|jgi:hypothetical protein